MLSHPISKSFLTINGPTAASSIGLSVSPFGTVSDNGCLPAFNLSARGTKGHSETIPMTLWWAVDAKGLSNMVDFVGNSVEFNWLAVEK